MDTKILMQKVLNLAVQGKLAPQNPKDEPAFILLEHIREKRDRMVKDGLLKKKDIQNDTNIFIGNDGKHYEKFVDGKVKCIEKEIYFELPDGWCWCRLKDICSMSAGKAKARDFIYDDSSEGRYPCFGGNGIRGYVDEYSHDGMYSIIGRQGALCGNITIAEGKFYATEHAVVVTLFDGIDFQWSNYMLQALHLNDYATGAAQPGLSVANILNVLVAIPPFSEQVRIGKLINSTINIINTIENDEHLIKELSSLTKSKVLDFAIRGELVPQDTNDEPASVLLERIKAKKERLIKEGKIKRDKHESVICKKGSSYYETINGVERCIDEEIPFDIPENWEWVRLGTLFSHNAGKALNASNNSGQLLKYLATSNLYWNRFELGNLKEMYFKDSEIEKYSATKGDLLVCEGGDVGKAAIWNFDYDICLQNHIHRLRAYLSLCTEYYYYIFYYYKIVGIIAGKGTTIAGLSSDVIHTLLVPLPPLEEQKRIALKIDKILLTIEEF